MEITEKPSQLYKHSTIDSYLKNTVIESSKILDIGCEVPIYLFEIEMQYAAKIFHGIDILPNEHELIKRYSYLQGNKTDEIFTTIQECHAHFIESYGQEYGLSIDKIKESIKNYKKNYTIETGINCLEIDENKVGEYDVVFAVGLLHFLKFKDSLSFITKLTRLVKSNGMLVITANHEEHASMTDPEFSTKIGKRVYKAKNMDGIVYLYDDYGFKQIINKIEKNGFRRMAFEKHKNDNKNTFEGFLYIAQKEIT